MKEIKFQRGGVWGGHPHGACCDCLFADQVCFIVRRGGIKVSTRTEITPVEQPFGFEVSLKNTVNTA